jgi:dihydrolipoamide dehydrogenase
MVVGDVTTGTDVLVIGGGPGGYVAAIRAGQLDLDVTLVEMDNYGGTCLNHGCIPSKALISATDIAHSADEAERMGIYADPAVDMQGMVSWKDRLVTRLTKGVESLCSGAGAALIEGRAEFAGENSARIVKAGDGQGAESIEFEHAVIATGSRPVQIPNFAFDSERILSSRDALALEKVPDSMVIVGGGYIGMELATVFQKLGCDVTVVEQLDSILPAYGEEVTEVVHERAESLGIDFAFGHAAADWEETESGLTVHTATEADNGGGRFDCENCLVAVGRQPVTDTLNLDAAGLEPVDGRLDTDERARTDKEHIFAVGDVAGEPMLAHKAFGEGEVAAEVIAGEPAALDYQAIPAAVFTDPEIATVGMTESEATEAGFEPVVGKMPLRASGRSLTLNEREGFVKVVADAETEFVLGAQIVGPEASELVAELALAIELGATLEDVAATIHVHPTLSEAVHEAVKGARGQSIHY